MDLRRKKMRNVGQFSAEELEVAEALLSLCQFRVPSIPQWGATRERSKISRHPANWILRLQGCKIGTTGSPISPLNLNGFSGSDVDDRYGEADLHPTPPPLPSARRLSSTTQKSRQGVNPCRRAPKRKTHGELKEMVNALHVENEKLQKDKRQLLKTHQALQDWNNHLKSELGKKQTPPLASMQAALDDPDLGHKTKTATCFEEVPILDGNGCSKIIADALPLDMACKESCSNGRLMSQHSPEFSCHSERDYSQPTKDVFPVGLEDLNVPCKDWFGPVRSGYRDCMLSSLEKAAFSDEARKAGNRASKSQKLSAS